MKRPTTIIALGAVALSSILAIQVASASGESVNTECWDVYNLRGTKRISTIAPAGLNTDDCTPAVGCYYGYRASDGKRNRWIVPHGLDPKVACASTTAVAPTTTAAAPTTTAVAPTTTAVAPTTTAAAPTTTAVAPTTTAVAPTTTAVAPTTTAAAPTTTAAAPTTTAASPGVLSSSATADPAQVAPGATVSLSATVRADIARTALVDLEVYSANGTKVFQNWWDNQSFAAGQSRTYSTSWTVPSTLAAGTYTLKVGVFGAGWSSLIAWNDAAGSITVGTASTTTPSTTPVSSARFETLPPGAELPSGAECATRVRPAVEIRPENATENGLRGSRANANTRSDWSQFARVDGDFAGTTDEIIQWAACKWGIDEDIARAQVIKESYWYQSANGDNGQSWGLGQVRDTAHQSAFQFPVNARTSSAYNLDYTYASWRACYEGVYTWLNTVQRNGTYAAGDLWGCVGVWFSGRWYVNNDAYLNQVGDSVRWHYDNKTWLTTSFING